MLAPQDLASLSANAVPTACVAFAVSVAFFHWLQRTSNKPPLPHRDGLTVRELRALPTCKPLLGDTLDMLKHLDTMHDWMVTLGRDFNGEAYGL